MHLPSVEDRSMMLLHFAFVAIVLFGFGTCSSITQCRTDDNSRNTHKNQPCAFPFKYGGKLRHECITDDDHNVPPRLWCPTKVLANGEIDFSDIYWGYCTPECSTPPPQDPQRNEKDLGTWKPKVNRRSPLDSECGQRLAQSNIVGGEVAKLGDHQYMALLGYQRQQGGKIEYGCGGSVINAWYVLTAAHCVDEAVARDYGLTGTEQLK